MFKTILSYIIAFIGGVGAVLLLIARGKRDTIKPRKDDVDRNNSRIRHGYVRLGDIAKREAERIILEREDLKRERARLKRDKATIKNTRRTVSDIIAAARKTTDTE